MSFNLAKDLSLNPSAYLLSERWGYDYDEENPGTSKLKKFVSTTCFNLFLLKNNLLISNLSAGVGVLNLTDATIQYLQPYASDHAPLPGPSRELQARLSYKLEF